MSLNKIRVLVYLFINEVKYDLSEDSIRTVLMITRNTDPLTLHFRNEITEMELNQPDSFCSRWDQREPNKAKTESISSEMNSAISSLPMNTSATLSNSTST